MPPLPPADIPPAARLDSLRYELDYRMCIVLEPDGVVRALPEGVGLHPWMPEAYVGHHIADLVSQGVRGDARGEAWRERLAAAAERGTPQRYADLRPNQGARGRAYVDTTITPVIGPQGGCRVVRGPRAGPHEGPRG